MTDLRITAVLAAPVTGLEEHDFMLDGPVAWAAWQAAENSGVATPAMTDDYAHDFDLPFARWEAEGTWGWCVSRAHYTVAQRTATEIRRKPATREMARFTTEREHHSGLGPHKARDITVGQAWVTEISWDADVTDQPKLERLLSLVSHVGRDRRVGSGRVVEWRIEPGEAEAWRDRPMPSPGFRAYRAPYWHQSRKVAL